MNRALAVYCLVNQGTQRAQIVLHKMNTYAFMDQNLAVIVFLEIPISLVENAAENIQGKNSLPDSGCYKSKKVSMFIIFIPL